MVVEEEEQHATAHLVRIYILVGGRDIPILPRRRRRRTQETCK